MEQDENTTFEIREFVGKKVVKKGNSNGKDWKLYELEFSPINGGKFNQKFKAFDSIGNKSGLKLSEMEELESYNIGYRTESYEHPKYGKQESRTIFFVDVPKEFQNKGEEIETITPKKSSLEAVKKAYDNGELEKEDEVKVTLENDSKLSMTVKEVLVMLKNL